MLELYYVNKNVKSYLNFRKCFNNGLEYFLRIAINKLGGAKKVLFTVRLFPASWWVWDIFLARKSVYIFFFFSKWLCHRATF